MGQQFGRYTLLKQMTSGSLGEVYLARLENVRGNDGLRVVKQINRYLFEGAQLDPAWLEEIERDNGKLRDPRLIVIDDLGAVGETPYAAMSYVFGDTVNGLGRWAKRAGRSVPVDIALRVVAETAEAMAVAHAAGVVHGNLHPRNVLVGFEDGRVAVTDFGLSKLKLRCGRVSLGTLSGKYTYLAPEQLQVDGADERTDVFALGVVLYELVTGRHLFKQKGEYQTVAAIQRCAVPSVEAQVAEAPAGLDALLGKTVARDPATRFATAGALQEALREVVRRAKRETSTESVAAFMQDLYASYLAERVAPPG